MESFSMEYIKGLSQAQVQERVEKGLCNISEQTHTKSYRQIFKDNVFTLFNLINAILAGLIVFTGNYKNLLFLGVVFSNIFIGCFQEIRAKRTLDKISLIVSMKACVIREGKEYRIAINEVVLDDIVKLKSGSQIVADSVVVANELEVDESLLTGESDVVIKRVGDFLYSGSFVVGSQGYAKVVKVGNDNYASQIVKDAKKFERYPSQLRDSLNKIIKFIGIAIIPLGILLFSKQFFFMHQSLSSSILSTSAALIGMIPEGLVILTSIALALGTIHLAKHKTLVQELFCLETLARVDVLCLDKTGTITEGKMEMDRYIPMINSDEKVILGNMIHQLNDDNATINALKMVYTKEDSFHVKKVISFNSKKKYSGVIFEEGSFLIGAYEFIVKNKQANHLAMIEKYASQGYRIITLVASKQKSEEHILDDVQVLGFILLLDKIRASAKETLDYFREQKVAIKVISGDHPITVSQVAKRAGLVGYEHYVDATTLKSEADILAAVQKYNIFGRVSPQQKKQMVIALKQLGHTVGMSGDGVNDVLAFKEANVSIAMASGSDVAKASANLVLLDSDFKALPYVLFEGRRVINNIQRVATLFLTKTIFSFILTLVTLFVTYQYPFIPIHLTFVSSLTIGIPAFFLALEPNRNRVEKNFLENVMKISFPAAVGVIVCICYIYVSAHLHHYSTHEISQLALIVISINGLLVLTKVAYPYTKLRIALVVFVYAAIIIGLVFGYSLFEFPPIQFSNIYLHISVFIILLISIASVGNRIVRCYYYLKRRKSDYKC
ncbi:MAG: HAD family hydrolase [Erysipelotrichia bacterium]|nr:HAD family hydrolase [Erysipelotrichia bacterium]NCC54260.1 HAD family hydrolase [Erysipelotrichia bacterium]